MKVSELIEKLAEYDPNDPVKVGTETLTPLGDEDYVTAPVERVYRTRFSVVIVDGSR